MDRLFELETQLAAVTDAHQKIDTLNALAWELRETDPARAIALCNQACAASTDEFAGSIYASGLATSLAHLHALQADPHDRITRVTQFLRALPWHERLDADAQALDEFWRTYASLLETELHATSATTDRLTHLINHPYFLRLAEQQTELAIRYERPVSLLLIDLDKLKFLNETYGHDVGDHALVTIADHIRATLRKMDLAARFGGDEFIVLLPETDYLRARQVAERLRARIAAQLLSTPTGAISISICQGIADFPNEGEASLAILLQHADDALYVAQQAGKNQLRVWHHA